MKESNIKLEIIYKLEIEEMEHYVDSFFRRNSCEVVNIKTHILFHKFLGRNEYYTYIFYKPIQ